MKLDFKEEDKRRRYPDHGWAMNSENVRLLWLPIMRVLANSEKIRSDIGLSRNMGSRQREDIHCLFATIGSLSVALRELARAMREIESLDPIEGDDESMNKQWYLRELIKLHADLCVMFLRRLSDAFCRSIRYVLFDPFESAPREFKKLITMASENAQGLLKAGPLCSVDLLKKVLCENSAWFADIRGMNRGGLGKKGIRDVLDHDTSSIEITRDKAGDGPWETKALLRYASESNLMSFDVLSLVKSCVSQLCGLWTQLYKLLPLSDEWKGYRAGGNIREGDIYFVFGNDMDATRLWPPIWGRGWIERSSYRMLNGLVSIVAILAQTEECRGIGGGVPGNHRSAITHH